MIMFNEMLGDWRENAVTVEDYIIENRTNDNASEQFLSWVNAIRDRLARNL